MTNEDFARKLLEQSVAAGKRMDELAATFDACNRELSSMLLHKVVSKEQRASMIAGELQADPDLKAKVLVLLTPPSKVLG